MNRGGDSFMKSTAWLHVVAFTLVVIGAINWGLVGLLNVNLVEMVFGVSMLTQLVYVLVGLSGLYLVFCHKEDCRSCEMLMKTTKKRK